MSDMLAHHIALRETSRDHSDGSNTSISNCCSSKKAQGAIFTYKVSIKVHLPHLQCDCSCICDLYQVLSLQHSDNRRFSAAVTRMRKFDYYSADHTLGGSHTFLMYCGLWGKTRLQMHFRF